MITRNSLAAERWYLPPVAPQPGAYWLTIFNRRTGKRDVYRAEYDPAHGWPAPFDNTLVFTVVAFMRADAPEPYQF